MLRSNACFWFIVLTLSGWGVSSLDAENDPSVTEVNRLAGLEFRAYLQFGNEDLFSLFDPTLGRSFWLELNVPVEGLRAVSFHRETEQLVVAWGDFQRTLGLGALRGELEEEPVENESTETDSVAPAPRTGTDNERLVDLVNEAREKSERFQGLADQLILSLRDFRGIRREFSDLQRGDPDYDILYDVLVQLGREMDEIVKLMREDAARMIEEGTIANVSERDQLLLRGHMMSILFQEENEREKQASR